MDQELTLRPHDQLQSRSTTPSNAESSTIHRSQRYSQQRLVHQIPQSFLESPHIKMPSCQPNQLQSMQRKRRRPSSSRSSELAASLPHTAQTSIPCHSVDGPNPWSRSGHFSQTPQPGQRFRTSSGIRFLDLATKYLHLYHRRSSKHVRKNRLSTKLRSRLQIGGSPIL